MKIGILASGNLGFKVLSTCLPKYQLVFIATDKRSDNIIEYSREKDIKLFLGNPRNNNLGTFIKDFDLDVILSINYLFIIERDVITRAKYAINIHGSLLPKYRGRTPHVWAIINNEKYTGVTAHIIEEECDEGPVVLQKKIPIASEDTGADLVKKFESTYPEIIISILEMISTNSIKPIQQDHSKATWFGKRTPEDGRINWNWQKERIKNWVRAQAYPYPGAFSYLEGEKIIIDKVSYSDVGYHNEMPNGYIVDSVKEKPLIKTPNGVIMIENHRNHDMKFEKGKVFHYE